MSNQLSLKPSYYDALKRLTLELAGIKLGREHNFLVETRLSALARKEGFDNLSDMIEELFSRGQTRLAVQVVASLLERASQFFADRAGYETLGDILLPALHRVYRGGTLRILSYGCSSGQEVYSTAILVDKFAQALPNMTIEVTGVDFPSWALERAKIGRFTHFEIQRGLPIRHLIEYFDRDGEDWVAKEKLRKNVRFVDHNLLSNPDVLGTFQIVMFRGKLQYYSSTATVRVLHSLSKLVCGGGYMMLGSNEALEKLSYGFNMQSVAPGCYQKPVKELPVDTTDTDLAAPQLATPDRNSNAA